jgi:hypothetical protein
MENKADSYAKAVQSIIFSWGDLLRVRGRLSEFDNMEFYLYESLSDPAPILSRLFREKPDLLVGLIVYNRKPIEQRIKVVSEQIRKQPWQDVLPLIDQSFSFLADLYKSKGITLANAEKLIEKKFEDALSNITLDELVGIHEGISENEIRDALSKLKLTTGSIAGADKRLKDELNRHYGPEYEQDIKIALWECSRGNKHFITEILKLFEKMPENQKPLLFVRMFVEGKEPKVLRATLLRILRRTIADLPGIAEAIRDRRRREEHKASAVEMKYEDINQIEEGKFQRRLETIEWKSYLNQMTPGEIDVFSKELERLDSNKTREEWYGEKDAQRVTQRIKYIKSKYN